MLREPSHLSSAKIYAASAQVGVILDFSKRMTIERAQVRRNMFEIIRPSLAALRWLNQEGYGRSKKIAATINRLERELEALADRPLKFPPKDIELPSCCPVCGCALTSPTQYDPIPHCASCLDDVPSLIAIQSFGVGFGTMAI